MEKHIEEGLRFNEGKPRYDLVHPVAQRGLVNVLTKGAEKYAERNWEKGMRWSKVIASMKRHIAAFERGEDYDPETGLLHADHIQCNAHFLSAYYKIAPQHDDRRHNYLNPNKIGLDIDEVLADFVGAMMDRFPEMEERSVYWNDPHIMKNFNEIAEDKDFWMQLSPKVTHKEMPFEPHCYITSRSIPVEWTEEWLSNNGFPASKVYSVGRDQSKIEVAKESGIDWFVDDRYENFIELNQAGICTFLFDAPHNRRYDVGFKRIKSLKDLFETV